MVKSGQTWSGLVVTKDATGALATPSVGPAGVLYVDGTANGATVTVTGSNPYKWTVTLPSLTAGQCVSMYITATIATIATASVVAEDVADTVRLSDVPAVNVTLWKGSAPSSLVSGAVVVDQGALALETTAQAVLTAVNAIEPGGGSYAGDGTGYYSDTIDDGTSPLDGVRVQLYTSPNRVGPAYEAYTNALGVFVMHPDPGTYYRWLDLAGFSFTQDVAVVVTEP